MRQDATDTLEAMGQAKTVKVKFTTEAGGKYQMEQNGAKKNQLVFNKTNDNMKKQDYYLIEFDLDDQSGLNLSFAPNPMHALWVDFTAPVTCPTSAVYSDEFFAVCVDPSGQKLTVRNDDSKVEDFAFTLRFLPQGADPKDQSSYVDYDPIGQNQDGGS